MSNHGFTLLDVMITVAIIGILATVAVPAYFHYNAEAKTAEAKLNLDLIGKGAYAFFVEEHSYNNGLNIHSHEYPTSNNTRDSAKRGAKGDDGVQAIGGMPYQSYNQMSATDGRTKDKNMWNDGNAQLGIKHNPADFEYQFSHYPWLDLNFRIVSPFYFSYNYQGEVSNKKSRFAASASACLIRRCVTHNLCDYGYVIVGTPTGKISPLMDNSDFKIEHCGKARLSEVKKKVKYYDF